MWNIREISILEIIKFERIKIKRIISKIYIYYLQLKNILNSIFHQDSSVLKLLADKKVYEDKGEGHGVNGATGSGLKKSGSLHMKQDMLDLVATSDNFFIGTGDKITI